MDSWVKLPEFRSLFHHLLSCRRIALGVLILKIRLIIVPHRHVKKLKKGNTHKEKAMVSHSSILAWKIPWTEEPGGLQSMGLQRVRHSSLCLHTAERLHFHFSLSCIGEGNGNPLQCSCLENPRDGGAWWAAVSGVAQTQTQLKWLSSSSSSNTHKKHYIAPVT